VSGPACPGCSDLRLDSVDDQAAATGTLGEIEGVIGSAQQLRRVLVGSENGHARADRRRDTGNSQDRPVREREQVIGDRFGVVRSRRQAARRTRRHRCGQGRRCDAGAPATVRRGDEDVVADVVAECVVQVLEVVDVEEHEGATGCLVRDGEALGKLDIEGPAVVSACQRIA